MTSREEFPTNSPEVGRQSYNEIDQLGEKAIELYSEHREQSATKAGLDANSEQIRKLKKKTAKKEKKYDEKYEKLEDKLNKSKDRHFSSHYDDHYGDTVVSYLLSDLNFARLKRKERQLDKLEESRDKDTKLHSMYDTVARDESAAYWTDRALAANQAEAKQFVAENLDKLTDQARQEMEHAKNKSSDTDKQ